MPVARYLTRFRNGKPDVPAGVFAGADGYGWRVVSHVPSESCIVELISTQEILDATDANSAYLRIPDYTPLLWQARTAGGAGGSVIHVTTLAASGEGSLNEALKADGARRIVFDVAGTIDLISAGVHTLTVTNPHLTIDGSTAPAGGICLRGRLAIVTHDVIVQHLRFRPGADPVKGKTNGIVLTDTADSYAYNVWIDHCSLSWATDENFTLYPTFGHIIENVEISHCLIYEGLNNSTHPEGAHSTNMLISNGWRNISIHHCLFALSADRNPQIAGGVGEEARVLFANNVVYGCLESAWFWGGIHANVIGNTIVKPSTAYDIELSSQASTVASSLIHVSGNTNPERAFTVRHSPANTYTYVLAGFPLPMPAHIMLSSAEDAYTNVLASAGALPRDTSDARIVAHVLAGTGVIIDDPSEVGGYPDLTA